MARRYAIRTFGCQMNEHDSERIAGLLEADGLEATDDVHDADVVVLNTCCIRENADNKLYGNLGQLKAVKAARPGMQIAVVLGNLLSPSETCGNGFRCALDLSKLGRVHRSGHRRNHLSTRGTNILDERPGQSRRSFHPAAARPHQEPVERSE